MKYEKILERIPGLVRRLDVVRTDYVTDGQAIGEAVSMLVVLHDLLIGIQEIKNEQPEATGEVK